ncbi:MAG: purine-nucleoside phosphorylase [Sphaerochaetaceae bacterium]|jgi:purine-nucleoside phosphorylase
MKTPTVHIGAAKGDIAPTILLPGDPLRAKFIAEHFLTDATCYSSVRGMYGYTGTYNNQLISVQGTGMGGPSMGIYAHELIHAYDVKRLIRIGSAGALDHRLHIGDLVMATAACYDADYNRRYGLEGFMAPAASFDLMSQAHQCATKQQLKLHAGTVLTSDIFYHQKGSDALRPWQQMGVLAVEMEAASLYIAAQSAAVKALCLLTISDLPFEQKEMDSSQREKSLTDMIALALDVGTNNCE